MRGWEYLTFDIAQPISHKCVWVFSLGRIFEENTPKVGGKQTIAILKTKRNMKTETDGRHRHNQTLRY